ncbi:MAG: hypothetical protein E6I60_11755, partial [Chloroflexi bacterium]
MVQPSSPRDPLLRLRRSVVALVAGGGLALTVLPGVPAWAGSNQEHVDRQVVRASSQGQPVRVIIVARDDLNRLDADLHRTGIKHIERVPIGHGLATELTPVMVQHFSRDPNVERIVYDAPVRLIDAAFDPAVLASTYPAVVDAVAAWSNGLRPVAGRGIGVAVIDSGVTSHPDLMDRVTLSKDFNPAVSGTDDAYGHGTAVAGIIAGDGTASGGRYIGIAPRANVINLRVNDGSGAAPTSVIMNAILWAVLHADTYNIRVINLSLLTTVAESYRTS